MTTTELRVRDRLASASAESVGIAETGRRATSGMRRFLYPVMRRPLVICVAAVLLSTGGCRERSATAKGVTTSQSNADRRSSLASIAHDRAMVLRPPSEPSIQTWKPVDSLNEEIAVFEHVFWQPEDTDSLRKLIRETGLVNGRKVLEIGTGSGVVALCCLQANAATVVATDINPWAVRNAVYNARLLKFDDRLQVRQVAQNRAGAWAVVGPEERFDVILSNPPWELGEPVRAEDFAFYDPGFQLMESILDGLPQHLNPQGRAFLAYGCVTAVRQLQKLVRERGHDFTVLDDRDLDSLPEVFLPGMLIEVRLQVKEPE